MQIENEEDRNYVRDLSYEQLKAKMPMLAQTFFDRHPPLLWAWKYSLLGDRENQSAIISNYFTTMPADHQYMLVTELASITTLLLNIDYAEREVERVKQTSKQDDTVRFGVYGANFHFDYADAGLLVRALKDQLQFLKNELNTVEDLGLRNELLKEVQANRKAMDSLLDQMIKQYPSLKQM